MLQDTAEIKPHKVQAYNDTTVEQREEEKVAHVQKKVVISRMRAKRSLIEQLNDDHWAMDQFGLGYCDEV